VAHTPIACTLQTGAAVARTTEWRGFLSDFVVEVERSGTSARLRLKDTDAAVLVATDLARREKACCAFFDFTLVPLPESVWLEVTAPAEAAAIIDELFRPGTDADSGPAGREKPA
jgi:hypothetical protein